MQAGLGVRPELFEPISGQLPPLGFLEAHSENYFGDSITRAKLLELRQHYPVSLHGVGLSLGRADHLDQLHLEQLKQLVAEVDPILVSEHLAWSAYSHRHLPDLLPLPLTEQSLAVMCDHIDQMQDTLQRQVLVENPSNYLLFDQLQIPEPEFLNTLAERTGCGLLVDVNNIHVSSTNLERDPESYLAQLESGHIKQYHLAGYVEVEKNGESVLIDTHNQTVYPQVWQLYESAIKQHGARPTLLEWDSDFPEFSVLLAECVKANQILIEHGEDAGPEPLAAEVVATKTPQEPASPVKLAEAQSGFLDQLLGLEETLPSAIDCHQGRLWVYQNNVFAAIKDYLQETFPATCGVVGEVFFKQLSQLFAQKLPPSAGNVYLYGERFAEILNEFEALQNMPYLHDLVEYEWALNTAYFADMSGGINPADYEQAELLSLPVVLNPSTHFVRSEYPIYEIHRQSLPGYKGEVAIDLGQSQDSLLVYKQQFEVKTRVLSEEEAHFLENLQNSDTLLQGIEALQGSLSAESLSAALAMVFELGLLAVDTVDAPAETAMEIAS
ncbi:MAG: DUF692 family multinuclear iron-containing protein [Pseudomonadota bacterium]